MYRYGLIGNCQISAHVANNGSIDWLCFPRPDAEPIFGRLLDPDGGFFQIEAAHAKSFRQSYIPNTNVLETIIEADDGILKITDFCPRFSQFGRVYRPIQVIRIVDAVEGTPRIVARCRPVAGWSKERLEPQRGNSHLRFNVGGESLRLTTNMSLTYLIDEQSQVLQAPLYFSLSWNLGIEEELEQLARGFLSQTIEHWRVWVKNCSVPTLFQKETIRSALALKLHCYEDTGAVLAALTTSLPEEEGGVRNWDYRYCWLRDAYFTLSAFNRLGHFEEMEKFLAFLIDIAKEDRYLKPVYTLDRRPPLPEREHPNWRGFADSSPVRTKNQAAEHVQNDVYGEMVLTVSPIFLDERFCDLRTGAHERLLVSLAEDCARSVSSKDAGLWELRSNWQEHTFTNLMAWAGLNRVNRIAKLGYLGGTSPDLERAEHFAAEAVKRAARDGSVRNGPDDATYDASMLLLPILGFPDPALNEKTALEIAKTLRVGDYEGFLYRYKKPDDFGTPRGAFVICSFWLVQALARVGRKVEASEVLSKILVCANDLSLLAEHFIPESGRQLGNFPQAYSHVGMICAAFAVSPSWEDVL